MAASDSVIWEIINNQFCAFKIQYVQPVCPTIDCLGRHIMHSR